MTFVRMRKVSRLYVRETNKIGRKRSPRYFPRTVGKNEYYYECVLINKFTLMC